MERTGRTTMRTLTEGIAWAKLACDVETWATMLASAQPRMAIVREGKASRSEWQLQEGGGRGRWPRGEVNANPKASTVRAGCGVRKVTGRKYARREKGARSRSVHVGGVWSIAQVVADADWKIVEPKKKLRPTFEASQGSCTKYSRAGNKDDRGQRVDFALKGFKKLEGGDTKNMFHSARGPTNRVSNWRR